MKIQSLEARKILDSRGEWTVEATLELKNGTQSTASVPQGRSTGSSEAHSLPADVAVRNIEKKIAAVVKRGEFRTQEAFDNFLIKLDGKADKSRLGANAILAASIAFARATAAEKKMPLWKYIREQYDGPITSGKKVTHPRLFMNLINGGLHSGSNLELQEYVVIPKTTTFREAVEIGQRIDHALGKYLERNKGKQALNVGDEGGFAPNFKDELEPIRILHATTKTVVREMKLHDRVDFGMDAAATNIKKLKADELADIYEKLARDENFIYIEDPFPENAFALFGVFTKRFGKRFWIAGDDLTTTNVQRMERAHAEGSVNAIIIKPNQIGSVTEALAAVRAARGYNWAVIASHRSGETNDDFIADFAYGVAADGLKLGAPTRGERVAKYNRLLQIENEAKK